MIWLRRTSVFLGLVILLLAASSGAAGAADVVSVSDEVATTGFYLDRGVSVSESDATEIVSAARNSGSRFYLVVLDDTPPGGNTAFAEAVFDELAIDAGTILVLSAEDVGWVSQDEGFTGDALTAAFEYANSVGGNDATYAANFVVGLFGVPDAGDSATDVAAEPVPSGQAAGSDGSGGGSGLVLFLVIIGGIGLLMFWLIRRSSKSTVNVAAEQMAKARAVIQKQVDAVANDILDLEDEVRVADNAEADQYYNAASDTYRTVTERLQQAETPQQLLDISNDLDQAIWQLDCAEAVLDGKPKPPQPERQEMPAEPQPSRERVTIPAPRRDTTRRPSRRSSYLGPGMLEMLIGVAGQVLAGGRGRSGLGSMLRIPSSRRSSSPPPASRGGGGIVPGPGSPVTRRSTRSSRSSSSRRRGGGRVRGGGRRRR